MKWVKTDTGATLEDDILGCLAEYSKFGDEWRIKVKGKPEQGFTIPRYSEHMMRALTSVQTQIMLREKIAEIPLT